MAKISIIGEIGWEVTAEEIQSHLSGLQPGEHLDITVHSVGGDVLEGTAIYNLLNAHAGPKTVTVIGLAASMASVISMAVAGTLRMAPGSMLMIHNPSALAYGESEDMKATATLLDIIREQLIDRYEAKTGIAREEIARLMDEETYFTAKDAVEKGFADELVEGSDGRNAKTLKVSQNLFQRIPLAARKKVSLRAQSIETPPSSSQVKTSQEFVMENIIQKLVSKYGDSSDLLAQATRIASENESLSFEAVCARVDNAAKDKAISDLKAQVSDLDGQVKALTTERDDLKARVEAAEARAETSEAKIRDFNDSGMIDFSTGDEPGDEPEGAAAIVAKYKTLKGSERSEFYSKHKTVIQKAHGLGR